MLRRKGSICSAGRGVDCRAGSHDGRAADDRRQFGGSHLNGCLGDCAVGGDADFSARRRRHDRRGNAAGLAIVGADPKKWVELQSKIGVPVLMRI